MQLPFLFLRWSVFKRSADRLRSGHAYCHAAKHPYPCLLLILPLLVAYEWGVACYDAQGEWCRNGADLWLRHLLGMAGLTHGVWVPGILVAVLAVWCWQQRRQAPADLLGGCLGIVIEACVFGAGLWLFSQLFGPLLDRVVMAQGTLDESIMSAMPYLGAGIYEEMIFRFGLYSSIWLVLRVFSVPAPVGIAAAALVSATLFAAAHHVGSMGEPFDDYVFLFRAMAGVYFACIYQWRGLGVAVGSHTCYDLLVGINLAR